MSGDACDDVDDAKSALERLGESDETRRDALRQIRAWLEEQPLRARVEDKYLLPFLRVSKFDQAKTKRRVTNYYTMKRDRPEWYQDRDPLIPELAELVKLGVFLPLRRRGVDKRLVVIIRTAVHDPKKHQQNDVFKVGKMILDVACMEYEPVQLYGVCAIFDMSGISYAHYRELTPGVVMNVVHAWQNHYVSPKTLEFVNAPVYVNIALDVFKRFMSSKMRDRVLVHYGGVESVPQDVLPPEYGGSGDSVAELADYWLGKLVEYRDWFVEDEAFRAD
ncbi:retinol-binding protein pinta-like [Cylas formicarius]|uniref:retinol-binding protein pinta-like n=1 Tax=Cylas formicarius TaxID=197179 RepID=UPI002958DD84|nr:retinol-binding protein pinta-like [Cylas formicarius]